MGVMALYYKSTRTGRYLDEGDLLITKLALGEEEFECRIQEGILIPVEAPTVIDLLKSGNRILAASRYRDIHSTPEHPVSMKKARQMVDRIEKDLERFCPNYTRQ